MKYPTIGVTSRMTNINKTDPSALSLVLYPYQFEMVSEKFIWSDKHSEKLAKLFDAQKLRIIGENIDHYFMYKDVDLMRVLPSMKADVSQKEILLGHIRKNIKIITD